MHPSVRPGLESRGLETKIGTCLSVYLSFTSVSAQQLSSVFFPPFFGRLPRVSTRVFFLKLFFHPFPAGCLGLIPGFFCFLPFSGGFVVYGRTGLCIFQMALPRVNTRGFFFSRPFPAGCPRLIPGFIIIIIIFAINRRSYLGYNIFKNKKIANLVKQCRGASL